MSGDVREIKISVKNWSFNNFLKFLIFSNFLGVPTLNP
jgi:hypothetical protein